MKYRSYIRVTQEFKKYATDAELMAKREIAIKLINILPEEELDDLFGITYIDPKNKLHQEMYGDIFSPKQRLALFQELKENNLIQYEAVINTEL